MVFGKIWQGSCLPAEDRQRGFLPVWIPYAIYAVCVGMALVKAWYRCLKCVQILENAAFRCLSTGSAMSRSGLVIGRSRFR